jgi:uncharacterized protein
MSVLAQSLAASALLLGATGSAHCLLMCAAPCSALCGQGGQGEHGSARRWAAFLTARAASYAAAGALAAASVSAAAQWSSTSRALAPLWTLMQMAAVLVALWWLVTGRPLWAVGGASTVTSSSWQPIRLLRGVTQHAAKPALWGLGWAAWPCALLHSALLLAALSPSAQDGAVVMTVFALASTPGLLGWAGLAAWQQRATVSAQPTQSTQRIAARLTALQPHAVRLAGALLLVMAGLGWSGQAQVPLFCAVAF